MIGVDTNVLLRYALQDDGGQSPAATTLLTSEGRIEEPALVNPVVLMEIVWTLARRDRLDKPGIIALLDALATSRHIAFTDGPAIHAAIEAWRTGSAGFADYLIGALNRTAGASTTFTFDTGAAAHADFTLLR